MQNTNTLCLGLYEKALPAQLDWAQRLGIASELGFQFMEISIDEQPERQQRLDWDRQQRLALINARFDSGIALPSMCLSAHRRYPFGSADAATRQQAQVLLEKALDFAVDLGIRNIQLAGYDVYYESSDRHTRERFIEGMQWSVALAAKAQVMLSVEIMDTPFINSISKWREFSRQIASPWFTVYPDIGNLSAWGNDVAFELEQGIDKITAIHLKDTLPVAPGAAGQFRDVPFGSGCVDFAHTFAVLDRLKYQGPFLLEMWARNDGEDRQHIAQAKRWIEQQRQIGSMAC
ncbi:MULTISPECIES: L-ribulose-5-phosphate 3-epimerase [unclassified Serratia (in: enterobacteria)]|uniref:L-ribulose-5-phosphate 3-epimerase n=1 Tax=unclassified Serratia (in: enterobacteria) TaxID=2647522 RepID=UPI000501652A|nr:MULTISPECIES: L-ribulose-5-phosphate 3-epimerase [unclassified Serratia (in: enterobacteria)]KFK97624.1 xylulose 5-phosphate 3-epimerase [Serratia sp. Ag2]KFK98021.1 xylulose 5-phosphate 3-epimerase [Serratia sp. Ag1]